MPVPTTATMGPARLNDAAVASRVDFPAALDALRDAMIAASRGAAREIPKTMAAWDPSSSAHALGSLDETTSRVAFKTWVNTPQGATAIVSVFDALDGRLLAILDALQLGMLRTAGLAALATEALSPTDADTLAILGSGRQAFAAAHAITLVRPITRICLWSRTRDNCVPLAARIERELGVTTTIADSPGDAVGKAPIVSLVTRATDPFLAGGVLARGTHVNAVGAILPHAAELKADVLPRSSLTVVDSLDNARHASRELKEYYGEDFAPVRSLGRVLDEGSTRPIDADLTVYKGMGTGVGDLAVAALAIGSEADT